LSSFEAKILNIFQTLLFAASESCQKESRYGEKGVDCYDGHPIDLHIGITEAEVCDKLGNGGEKFAC
jgi:hypothetical protein